MKFTYGSYDHGHSGVGLRVEYQGIFDTFKRRMGDRIRFSGVGVLRATDVDQLTAKINALMAAYELDYQDAKLYDNDNNLTAHVLLNADTWTGIKVVQPPTFINGPWSGQPEYANQRTFTFMLQAETRTGFGLAAWKERLLIKGTGAPKWKYSGQIQGDPQYQILQANTSFWYIQEGRAVGHDNYVAPPGPLFPGIEHGDMREIIYETPSDIVWNNESSQLVGRMPTTQWKYYMEAVVSQGFSAFVLPGLT